MLAAMSVMGLIAVNFHPLPVRGYGYPMAYLFPANNCATPNPGFGCGYSSNYWVLGVDFLCWLVLAFGLILAFDMLLSRNKIS